jgi:hypothetical protein
MEARRAKIRPLTAINPIIMAAVDIIMIPGLANQLEVGCGRISAYRNSLPGV